jgi:phasin family protein
MFDQQSTLFKSLNKLTMLNVSASKSLLEQQVSFFNSALKETVNHAGKLSKTDNLNELLSSQKEFTHQLTTQVNNNIKLSAQVITENHQQILAIFQDEIKGNDSSKENTEQVQPASTQEKAVAKVTLKKEMATENEPAVKKASTKLAEVNNVPVTAVTKKVAPKVVTKKTAVKAVTKAVTKAPVKKVATKQSTAKKAAAKPATPIVNAVTQKPAVTNPRVPEKTTPAKAANTIAKPAVKITEEVEQAKPVVKVQTAQATKTKSEIEQLKTLN